MKPKHYTVFGWTYLIHIFCHVVWGAGFTELAGDLPKVISFEKSPYIVVADIYVPAGRLVRIEPGVVLLFKNFTSMHVTGVLHVNGTEAAPVVFTSENDYNYNSGNDRNPTPYDWNGMYIHKDGFGTDLKNFQIKFSVKGILSDTKYIRIINGNFIENGRANLTIEGMEKQVIAGQMYQYDISIKDAKADGIPLNFLKDPQAPKRNVFRYSGLTVLAGGATVGIISSLKLRSSLPWLTYLSDFSNQAMMAAEGDGSWHAAKKQFTRDLAGTIAGFSALVAGSIVFTWTFTY